MYGVGADASVVGCRAGSVEPRTEVADYYEPTTLTVELDVHARSPKSLQQLPVGEAAPDFGH